MTSIVNVPNCADNGTLDTGNKIFLHNIFVLDFCLVLSSMLMPINIIDGLTVQE